MNQKPKKLSAYKIVALITGTTLILVSVVILAWITITAVAFWDFRLTWPGETPQPITASQRYGQILGLVIGIIIGLLPIAGGIYILRRRND